MITLADFDQISTRVGSLYEKFTQAVLNDIVRRLNEGFTASAAWQVQRLVQSGKVYSDVLDRLEPFVPQTEQEMRQIFREYSVKSVLFDNEILKAAGKMPVNLNLSPAMMQVLVAGMVKTRGVLQNLTRSIAEQASHRAFIDAMDLAYMEVAHGAMSYNQALKLAVKGLAEKGISIVDYQSGRVDQLDVAARRAILTGVSQTAGQISMMNLVDNGVDLIAVSAHIGARNRGGLPENHEMWQGRIYSTKGNPKYPDFVTWTGYGTIEGLCGVNCRHSFYPYYEGISERFYTDKALADMANRTVVYNGKQMSFYEATQVQRAMERKIRASKRAAEALGSIGKDNTEELARVRGLQAQLRDFVKQTGIQRQPVREGPKVARVVVPKPIDIPEVQKQPLPISTPPVAPPVVTDAYLENTVKRGLATSEGLKTVVSRGTLLDEDPKRMHGLFESHRRKLDTDQWAIQKPQGGGLYSDRAQRETYAYEVDKALGLELVPETITWDDPLEGGSYQLFVPGAVMGEDAAIGDLLYPEDIGKMRLLDVLIGNQDRHGGNWLVKDGHLIAIDHNIAFSSDATESAIRSILMDEGSRMRKLPFKQQRELWGPILPRSTDAKMPLPHVFRDKLEELLATGWFQQHIQFEQDPYKLPGLLERAKYLLDHWDDLFEDPTARAQFNAIFKAAKEQK